MWRKLFIFLLIIIGVFLICSPFIKEVVINYMSTHFKPTELTAGQLEENNSRRATFDYEAIKPPSVIETIKGSTGFDKEALIGQITIKSIQLKLPILKGMTNQNLLVGATTMRGDQMMGEGNYLLAGHHMKNPRLLFSPLMNIKQGAIVELTDLKKIYIYEIIEKKIISENEIDVLQEKKDKQLTLITCDKATETNKRLMVKGKLIKVESYNS
ncbi:class A sortase [Heyndrickxia sporothermodurans]|nr:class A sortase [Heyndrickxia sporothermodurans]